MLLKVPKKSPRGILADAYTRAPDRFRRGSEFDRGDGKQKDASEAAYWYALAAGDRWAAAYTNLGSLYARGSGTSGPDYDAARLLWITAAAIGDGTAMFNLGTMAEKGIGRPPDPDMAKRWYSRGAQYKHAASAAALQMLGR